MNKQLISILSVIVSIVIALVLYLYFSQIVDKVIKPVEIVPENAAIIIEARQSSAILKALANPSFMNRLLTNDKISAFYHKLTYIDSLIKQDEEITEWFKKGEAVYSFHSFSNRNVGFFMAVQTITDIDPSKAQSFFQQHFPGRFKVSKRKFNNQEILDFTDFKEGSLFSIAFKNKLMMLSFDGSLVELALLKLDKMKGGPLIEDKLSFVQNSGDGFNLHLNYKNLPYLMQSAANENYEKAFDLLGDFGEKAIYNIHYGDEDILLKGAAQSHESNFQFLDLLNGQAPIKNTLVPLLPEAINFCFTFNYNGYGKWFKNVNEYMLSKKLFVKYTSYIDSIEANLQVRFGEKMASKFGNHAALISLNEPGIWKDSCYITAVEITDAPGFEQLLDQIDHSYLLKYGKDTLQPLHDPDGMIKKAYIGDAFKFYFTDLFEGMEANYYVIYKGYFFFANNAAILKALQNKWKDNLLLLNAPFFKTFEKKLAPQSNMELLINNEHAARYALGFLNKPWYGMLSQNLGTVKRAQWIGVQYAGSNDKVFAGQVYIRFNLDKADRSEQMWAIKLDTALLIDPFVVFNKSTGNHVIIVQDVLKQLTMIDRDGKVIWKQKIDGSVLSSFTEIDLYHNGKVQWVFNTSHYIYIIDQDGKNIPGWPVWVPTSTNYPVAVCDFNKDGNYQFFVTGMQYKVSGYAANGRLLPGWNPKDVYPNLKTSLNLFHIGHEPLLSALNEKGQLSIFTTSGKNFKGFGFDSSMHWLDYRLNNIDTGSLSITAIDSFNLYTITYSTTRPIQIKILPVAGFQSFEPLTNGGNVPIYVLKSPTKISIIDEQHKVLYQHAFADSSLTGFKWNYIGDSDKISYYDKINKKLNVQNEKGKTYKPFPIEMNGHYAIGNLFFEADNWLIYGNNANQLFLYRIK